MRGNIKSFVELAARTFDCAEPILEIGSLPAEGHGNISDLRTLFDGKVYVGSDYQAGGGVDVLLDAHVLGVRDGTVGSVITMDTAEHVQDPLLMTRDIHRVLRPDGILIMTSVMNFPIHNYPFDYWRYTPAAFDLMVRSFAVRAVLYQGNPLAPHTVLAIARKDADAEAAVAFDAEVATLQRAWERETEQAPLVRFEPLRETLVLDHDDREPPQTLTELTDGGRVEQTFRCERDALTRLDLKFETHDRMNDRHVDIVLRDEDSGATVAEGAYFQAHIVAQQWMPFIFAPIADSAGRRYRLSITSPDGRPGVTVSPVLSDDGAVAGGTLTENGADVDGSICLRVLCQSPDYEPPDYRRLAGTVEAVGVERGLPSAGSASAVRAVAKTQSAQLTELFLRLDRRLDVINARLDTLEERQNDVLLFVRNLQSSPPLRLARKIGGLLRRS